MTDLKIPGELVVAHFLYDDGEFMRVFVAHIPCLDPPPLLHDWLAEHEKPPKQPAPIRTQRKLFKSRKRRAVRQEVLQRDGYRCRYCGMDLLHDDHGCLSASVDHVIPS